MRPSFLIGALVVAVAVILVMQYWPEATPEPVSEVMPPPAEVSEPVEQITPEEVLETSMETDPASSENDSENDSELDPVSEPAVEPAVELPTLADSDAFVLAETTPWSLPQAWLQREDLLSRAAVVLQNAADGSVPRRQLSFMTPAEVYPVLKEGERYFVDPASYDRYDAYVETLQAIPAKDMARFIDLVSPLLTEALSLLGDRRTPAELVLDAIARLESLPDLGVGTGVGRVELLRPNVMYKYADPSLEKMTEFDKQLLRFGPENIAKMRSYAIEFKDYYLEN